MTRISPSDLLACERALGRITSSASFECKELHRLAVKKSTALNLNTRLYFEDLIKRRTVLREPLQYIIGEWDFSILRNIAVRSPVLIPRPETEELVRLVETHLLSLNNVESGEKGIRRLLEVGIGSGAVSISLLTLCNQLEALGIDMSNAACELTHENAIKFNVNSRLTIVKSDVFNWIDTNKNNMKRSPSFNVLVSNPPYIPDEEMNDGLDPEIKNWESQDALRGGKPYGLGFTLRLLRSLGVKPSFLLSHARAFFEVHFTHPAILIAILQPESRGKRMTLPPASSFGKGVDVDIPSVDIVRTIVSKEDELELQKSWRFIAAYGDFNQKPRFVVLEKKE